MRRASSAGAFLHGGVLQVCDARTISFARLPRRRHSRRRVPRARERLSDSATFGLRGLAMNPTRTRSPRRSARAVRGVVRRGAGERAERRQRDGAGHRDARRARLRCGWCCSRGTARDGFMFYTNAQSRKGGEILANPHAALLFHWKSLAPPGAHRRAARGSAARRWPTPISPRAIRDSQLGSAASDQSRPLDSRATYLARVAALREQYPDGAVPRPPHWTGFRLAPARIEFWLDRPHRLHERRLFIRARAAAGPARCSTHDALDRRPRRR